MRSITLAALLVAALSAPAFAQQTPGYNLSMPGPDIAIGTEFDICLEAPPNSSLLLLVSDGLGSVPTKFGTLCLKVPFFLMIPITMPDSGILCFEACAVCGLIPPGMSFSLEFISAGPAPGQFGVSNCTTVTFFEGGACEPGSHVTFTQGAYGGNCNGNNPACLLQNNFANVFPNGLLMGDPDGIDADGIWALLLTSATAVKNFLPQGEARDPFDQDLVDPLDSAAGVLGGQLATAKINVAFDDAGLLDAWKSNPGGPPLGDLIFIEGVAEKLEYFTVREVIAFADLAVSGAATMPLDVDNDTIGDVTFQDLNVALTVLNENYDNGTVNNGNLAQP